MKLGDKISWRIRPEIETSRKITGRVVSLYPHGNNGYSIPFMIAQTEEETKNWPGHYMKYAVELGNSSIEVIS